MRQGRLDQPEHGGDVGVECVLPLLVGDFLDGFVGHLEGGVVDQHVDAAELAGGLVDDGPAVFSPGEVAGDQYGPGAGLLDQGGGLPDVVVLAEISRTGDGKRGLTVTSPDRPGRRRPMVVPPRRSDDLVALLNLEHVERASERQYPIGDR